MPTPEPAIIKPDADGWTLYPRTLVCIDPGDRFIGTAFWNEVMGEWECTMTALFEDEHRLFFGYLTYWLHMKLVAEIVAEAFTLYPDKMQQQGYSRMETARTLGVIEDRARLAGVPYSEQGASIKKPTRRIMDTKGIIAVGKSIHEKDAELHGFYRVNNRKRGPVGSEPIN